MTDREMLEYAAKAAGMVLEYEAATDRYFYWRSPYDSIRNVQNLKVFWNPRDDDGDSFRLMVKLGLEVCVEPDIGVVTAGIPNKGWQEKRIDDGEDLCAATRLVIFSAAAMIGWTMKRAGTA